MKLTCIYFIVFFLIISLCPLRGQNLASENSEPPLYRHSVYGTAGYAPLYLNGAISYECIVNKWPRHFFKYGSIKASNGKWALWDDTGTVYSISYAGMTGKAVNHFEINTGVGYLKSKDKTRNEIIPNLSMGYRYHAPEINLVFRVGIGFPEMLHISIGLCFFR
jgi:hypothetical protein